MAQPATLLGRPGDLVPQGAQVDAYTTRIGGSPVLPPQCSDAMPTCSCPHCKAALVLLLQTHAPLPNAQDRFLYLLGCSTDKCPGSWKVLRCQLPSSHPASSSSASAPAPEQAQPDPAEEAAAEGGWGDASAAGDRWGTAAADWGAGSGTAGGWGEDGADEEAGGSAFDFEDLNAALDAAAAAAPPTAGGQRANQRQQQQQAGASPAGTPANEASSSGSPAAASGSCYAVPCLPSFYLVAQPEAQQAPAPRLAKKEREHLEQLLAQYEQEAGAALQDAPSGSSGSGAAPAAALAAGACLPNVEGGGESWGGEGYERDTVLQPDKSRRAGLSPAFIKFAKRLAACPDQCARYSFGGAPLWPSDKPPAPQPCAHCGAPAAFEVQLMAPAIHYLEESADWLEEEGGSGSSSEGEGGSEAGILRPPASWEWATVAVFSCSRSCVPEGGRVFVEEQALVENE